MDLGTTGRSSAALLSGIGARVRDRQALVVEEWRDIVAWAEANVVESPEDAATIQEGCYLDTGVPIAGEGARLVSEFALMELVAVLGRSPDGGRAYVGRVVECAWRLPETCARVLSGRVEPWRAERVADLTHGLCAEAALFVDHQLAVAVGTVSWALIERLVTEAMIRFDPERAEAEREAAAEERHLRVSEPAGHGLVFLDGVLDAADGHDLNQAIAREAHLLGRLGDESSLDVRRSKAVGALARRDLALDLLVADEQTGEVIAQAPGRRVTLNVHVTDTTLTGENPVGRWDEGRVPVSSAQVREWLQTPGTSVIVRPIIDLADCVPVGSYEIPDRHRIRMELRDHACRFPHCTRPAARCDLDHVIPHTRGGPTCPCNLVPLCRRHHRAKTHSTWDYQVTRPGHYEWTSPNGHHFTVTPLGTRTTTPPDR